ncbi:MAG: nucleotidyl transferase AbiEii/AbiGii toxin family protein [Candidatus Gracilibacteria bacterium]|nr:nucleotidyl transferase AbiEii/AbiGii toxin family protein [Candidatus Gracilibacteria bacterium]
MRNKKKAKYNLKLSYSDDDMNIKIDINRNIWESNNYERINFYGVDVLVQDKATILANKLVALIERIANRDIYDVYFFFKNNFEINEKVILERTGKTKKDIFIKILEILKKLPKNHKILDGLGEVLNDEKHKSFC